jgi:NAD(P)-dependent dehydrogenase (short-subunit alcohol dehydrogenase family)
MEETRIVITGSTRGLGLRLAREFLSRGCAVTVSGRTVQSVTAAVDGLKKDFPETRIYGFVCDTAHHEQVDALWASAAQAMGGVDHWINNAGIGQATLPIWELPPSDMEAIVRTDLLGVLHGARAAMRGMMAQGSGAIWFMEGHGSDGRIMTGLSVYGAAKRALRYVAHALTEEAKDTPVLVGTLSPGIMITDFTMKQLDRNDRETWDRTKKVFNILADTPETVAAFMVPRILSTRKTGAHIAWLTGAKIMFRFMTAGIARRSVMPE